MVLLEHWGGIMDGVGVSGSVFVASSSLFPKLTGCTLGFGLELGGSLMEGPLALTGG